MKKKLRLGIIAPSAVVGQIELKLGTEILRDAGFEVVVHPQCRKRHRFFAGSDEERARAFFDFARDPSIDALWCARGGYGAARLLPLLDRLTRAKGKPPRKLLLGYSDALAVNTFARERWGWRAIHAAMPGTREFLRVSDEDRQATFRFVRGDTAGSSRKLRWISRKPGQDVRGELVGGNLCVLVSLLGTPSFPDLKGKILFLEEIDEGLYRVDRMVEQLLQSGALRGVKALVLGDFSGCEDKVVRVLKKPTLDPKPTDLKALRPLLNHRSELPLIFGRLAEHYGFPLADGFPAGHGDRKYPLLLGGTYRLSRMGLLEFA